MRRERERKATGVAQIRRANGRNRSRTSLFAEADDPNPRVITTPRSKRVDTRGSIRGPPVDRERPFAPSSRSRRVGIDGPEPASAANDAQRWMQTQQGGIPPDDPVGGDEDEGDPEAS